MAAPGADAKTPGLGGRGFPRLRTVRLSLRTHPGHLAVVMGMDVGGQGHGNSEGSQWNGAGGICQAGSIQGEDATLAPLARSSHYSE